MKKSALLIASLLLSVSAFAANPEYLNLAQTSNHWEHIHQCLCDSWKAAKPTDAQNADAKPFIQIAKDSWAQHKDGLIQGKKDLRAAWSAYPISASEVEKAEIALHHCFVPLHIAMRDSTISILNLLSADQRKDFDKSFTDCTGDDDDFLSLK